MSSRWQFDEAFRNFDNLSSEYHNPVREWKHMLVGGILTRIEENSWYLRNALKYRWFIEGGLFVSKFSKFYYLIKFEVRSEMIRVLRQGTKVIYSDIFMLHPWFPFLNPQTFTIECEDFEILMHNIYPEQTHFINVKKITSTLGELIAFNDPITYHNGFSSMSIRVRILIHQMTSLVKTG